MFFHSPTVLEVQLMSVCRLVGWLVGRSVIISLKFGKLVTIYAPMYHLLFQQTSHWLREDRITNFFSIRF